MPDEKTTSEEQAKELITSMQPPAPQTLYENASKDPKQETTSSKSRKEK